MPDFKVSKVTCQMILRKVPAELHRQFKALCITSGETMQNRLIGLMRKDVNQYEEEVRAASRNN